jgi:hypothetical protein
MLDDPDVSARFDQWCQEQIRPWYDDHVRWDASLLQRMAGDDVDVEGPLPSDLICAAAEQDPSMMPVVGPFQGMMTLPTTLVSVEEQARQVLRTGWRPRLGDGPSSADLAGLIAEHTPAAGAR